MIDPVAPTGAPHVLVAEDSHINRQLAVLLLRDLGCLVDAVPDGRYAVEAFSRRRYDLVLMNCDMPGLDGYAATRLIRVAESRAGHSRRTPIVALTAFALPSDLDRCRGAGMDDVLLKPILRAPLLRLCERWLPHFARRGAAQTACASASVPARAV